MADPLIDLPDKPAFKAAEVCEFAQIPLYVLRSWEKEFPNLGVVPRAGAARLYRRGDVEQILHIKQLVFSEGLTLAGARRRLQGEPPPEPEAAFPIPEDVKARVGKVRQELQSLLHLLGSDVEYAAPSRPDPTTTTADAPAPPPSGGWPPAKSAATPVAVRGPKSIPSGPPDEPVLPLLDAEAGTTTPPPTAVVPGGTGRRRGRKPG